MAFGRTDYLLPGLRPSKVVGDSLEAANNRILCRIANIHRLQHETLDAYVVRRNGLVRDLRQEAQLSIRDRWGLKLTCWIEHLFRHKDGPNFQLIQEQDDLWLQTMRCLAGGLGRTRSEFSGSTCTRAHAGSPLRWGERWVEAVGREGDGWENPNRAKELTRKRACILCSQFLRTSDGRRMAPADG